MRNPFEVKVLLGVLLATMSFAPRARAQSQTSGQSSSASSQQGQSASATQSQAQAPAKPQGGSGNEPQMQSQEAPPPESLGEAARRARAQKAQAAGSKVYTEDKISSLSGHGVSVVGDGNQSSGSSGSENSYAEAGADSGNGGAASGGKSDEKFWRNKARAIHDQTAQIDERIAKIQEEIQKYGAVSFDPASGLRSNVIYVEDRNAQIKQLEAQKARLQSQMDSLEEEGRKAGADSGWLSIAVE
jgi:hypothetical protein